MGWTKRQIVMAAFEEIGLGAEVYDVQPGQLASALKRLDAMVAEWNGRGIRIGYPLPASPAESSLDDATNVPDSAVETLFLSLAVRIAPGYGKQVMPDTKASAIRGYNTLLARATTPVEMALPSTMPAGQGNKPWRWGSEEFLEPPAEEVQAGDDGDLVYD
jgi:hypothetical protein